MRPPSKTHQWYYTIEYGETQHCPPPRAIASNLSDEVKQEIIVHRGPKTLLAQAAFGGGALEQVESNRAQHRHVLSTLLVADTATVFTKGDSHHPMKAVLNRPVMLGGLQQLGSVGRETADVVGWVVSDLLVATSFALHPDDAVEGSPTVMVADMFKHQRVTDCPAAANFNPCASLQIAGYRRRQTSLQCPV
jgi:hypothetical protein